MIDEPENIDTSVWLKRGEPLVTPERAAKGDLKIEREIDEKTGELGEIRYAQAFYRNILNWLWENNHIDDQMHHDGQTYQIWREMHRASLGVIKPVSFGLDDAKQKLRAHGYILLLRRLSHHDSKTIESAIDSPAHQPFNEIAKARTETYHRAFFSLSKLLPVIEDKIRYLEGLSGDEQNELSEQAMKNFLESIGK